MGRAQVMQAEAAGIEPSVLMNPILLKPTNDVGSQVIVNGEVLATMRAMDYFKYKKTLIPDIMKAYHTLEEQSDIIVIEGAGSPAEINLKSDDIVNMGMAKMAKSPVLLVGDIDRGGVFAQLAGTMMLLEEEEKQLVKGLIINKFRGDKTILDPGIVMLEELCHRSVVGVTPYMDIDVEDEDSLSERMSNEKAVGQIDLVVVRLPRISNFTDFDALAYEPDVAVRFVKPGDAIGEPDMVILPGSKNTMADLKYLEDRGYAEDIKALAKKGVPVFGVCGGYQMLGEKLHDPDGVEGDIPELNGLGLLPTETTMTGTKMTHQVSFNTTKLPFLGIDYSGENLRGYEIHMGDTHGVGTVADCFAITSRSEKPVAVMDGFVNESGLVMGTYIHGILDNDSLRRQILNALRKRKGLEPLDEVFHYFEHKDAAYNRLADIVEKHLDMDYIDKLLEEQA